MNRPEPISDPGSDEQASLWAARLECSQLSASDRAELDSWLAGDPARREMLSGYCTLSAVLDYAIPELEASGAVKAPVPAPRRPAFLGWGLAVGGMALAAVAAGTLWFGYASHRPQTIAAASGERRSFTLSDGSKIELNANTSLLVENGRSERRVHLDGGEAFFVVSKDKSRPFIVETPAGSVRVTGTRFNVLSETNSELVVTVEEGTVQVRPGQGGDVTSPNPFVLTAGDKLSSEQGGTRLAALTPGEVDDALAWRDGQIVCPGSGMPLSEVLARFAHYHKVRISTTASAAGQKLGGRFKLDDLEGFLTQLPQVLPVRVKHEADGSIAVSLMSEP
ncbi:MAG TPA: FecR family protein [Opitutaceae bacterium]|jgi:transmembrane sensor|nr:FecR family protein [Opitutaceae bacterium]